MAKNAEVEMKMREICLSLPDTKLTLTWDKPHFRVGEKIFAGCGVESGKLVIGFKLEMEHARKVIQDPRFRPSPYVGHKGWVTMDAAGEMDWDEVRSMVLESYRLIAPKKTLAKMALANMAPEGRTPPAGAGKAAKKLGARRPRGKRPKVKPRKR